MTIGPLDALSTDAERYGLMQMGALHEDGKTIVLLGTDAGFWNIFKAAPEYLDCQPDPVDRYSMRVLPLLAEKRGALDLRYPFSGPPYAPFIRWAKATGEAFDSPTGMLVHIKAGLMISYRGALIFEGLLPLVGTELANPCDSCAGRPCETACPVDALSVDHFYDVPRCKSFLHSKAGQDCMMRGCIVRRACPISQAFARPEQQSAHHMQAFKGI